MLGRVSGLSRVARAARGARGMASDAKEGGFSTGLGMGFFIGAGGAYAVQSALAEMGSGKALFRQFREMAGASGAEDLGKLFDRIDRDKNGSIDGKELYAVCAGVLLRKRLHDSPSLSLRLWFLFFDACARLAILLPHSVQHRFRQGGQDV